MNRNEILETLLLKATGTNYDGATVWKEIENAANEAIDEGSQWVTGQDDVLETWEYYVTIKRTFDEKNEQWETSISLEEVAITDKKTGKTTYIQVKGAEI